MAGCLTSSPELQSETGARPAGTETSGRGEAGGSVVTTDSWASSPEDSAEADGGVEADECWSGSPESSMET